MKIDRIFVASNRLRVVIDAIVDELLQRYRFLHHSNLICGEESTSSVFADLPRYALCRRREDETTDYRRHIRNGKEDQLKVFRQDVLFAHEQQLVLDVERKVDLRR